MKITINDRLNGLKIKKIEVHWMDVDAEQTYDGQWSCVSHGSGVYSVKGCRVDKLTDIDSCPVITLENGKMWTWDKEKGQYVPL